MVRWKIQTHFKRKSSCRDPSVDEWHPKGISDLRKKFKTILKTPVFETRQLFCPHISFTRNLKNMFFEKYLVHFFWRKQQHYLWFCPIFFPNLFFQHVFLLFSVSSIPGRRYGPTKPKTWSSWGTGGWPGFCWGIHGGVQLSVRGFSQAISEFKKKKPINNLRIFLVSSFWGCMLMGYRTHHTFFCWHNESSAEKTC